MEKTCKHCKETFNFDHANQFANHVRWCSKNDLNGDKGASNISLKKRESFSKTLGSFKDFEVECFLCKKNFSVNERETRHPEKDKYFCSRSCANNRGKMPESVKSLIRKKLLKQTEQKTVHCNFCNNSFLVNQKKVEIFCSKNCLYQARINKTPKDSFLFYKNRCRFNFNLADFPGEFDFSLVEEHGWYSAKNRGNNMKGVSRDHIISVMFGFKNGIDPDIISHPANCRLLTQSQNASKGKKCDMPVEELIEKISIWNQKYDISPR
jgi:hypothetical protein